MLTLRTFLDDLSSNFIGLLLMGLIRFHDSIILSSTKNSTRSKSITVDPTLNYFQVTIEADKN